MMMRKDGYIINDGPLMKDLQEFSGPSLLAATLRICDLTYI